MNKYLHVLITISVCHQCRQNVQTETTKKWAILTDNFANNDIRTSTIPRAEKLRYLSVQNNIFSSQGRASNNARFVNVNKQALD